MPREYSMGGRAGRLGGDGHGPPPPVQSLRERFGALRNLPPFLRLVWETSRGADRWPACCSRLRARAAAGGHALRRQADHRRGRAAGAARASPGTPGRLAGQRPARPPRRCCSRSSSASRCSPTCSARIVSLLDSLLSERFTNATSVRLMEHAATLDLEDFEDSELQDRLERARRQTVGRTALMSQLFGQAQDVRHHRQLRGRPRRLRAVADRAAGRWRWCRRSSARRTSTRRATRSTTRGRRSGASSTTCARPGASVETAKEVKIFGLNALPDRALPRRSRRASSRPTAGSRRGAPAGAALLTAIGTIGYYVAYALHRAGARCAATSRSATSRSCPARSGACATCSRIC